MVDIGFYVTVATIISTVTGAVVAIVTALVQGWSGRRQAILSEKQADASITSVNMSAATQLTGVSIQQTAQFYQILQDANIKIQECQERERRQAIESSKRVIRLHRVLAGLKDILDEHKEECERLHIDCAYAENLNKDLAKMIAILSENGESNAV